MSTITILAMLVILGSALSITGFSVTCSVAAQTTGDNATMSGNMTGGNATGGNATGSISSTDDGVIQGGDGGDIIEGDGGDDAEFESDP
jgi:hypothetical protein